VTHRSYGQFCAAAKARDVLGERWTLLLVRELLLGPRRLTDLPAAQPGLSNSLLASRLKQLEAAGVIRHEQQPPPGSWISEITGAGLGAGLAVKALADRGLRLPETPGPEEARANWPALRLAASAPAEAVAGARETYKVHFDDEVLHLGLAVGAPAQSGPAPGAADLVIRTGQAAFAELSQGRADLADLTEGRRAQISGDDRAAARAARCSPPLTVQGRRLSRARPGWRGSLTDAAVPRRGYLNSGRAFRAVAAVGF